MLESVRNIAEANLILLFSGCLEIPSIFKTRITPSSTVQILDGDRNANTLQLGRMPNGSIVVSRCMRLVEEIELDGQFVDGLSGVLLPERHALSQTQRMQQFLILK